MPILLPHALGLHLRFLMVIQAKTSGLHGELHFFLALWVKQEGYSTNLQGPRKIRRESRTPDTNH